MAGDHSVLSPSKGEMILSCAAALGASKGVKDEPSRFAAEGTVYHTVSSTTLEWLKNGQPADTSCFVGDELEADGFKFIIDDENAAHAQTYVNRVRKIPGLQSYEIRVDTSEVVGVDGQGGTIDCNTLDFENDTIHVDDLKFGMRIVYAKGNKQLLQYGGAALKKYALLHDWKYLKVAIHQPRANGHYDEHTYTIEEVEAWIAENQPKFQRAYHLYLHPEEITAADFNPTDKGCEWCPIRGSCAARNQKFVDMFPKVSKTPLIQMSNAQLGAARTLVEQFEAWASSIKAEAHRRAVIQGEKLPGWKTVQGRRGNRKWEGEGVETALVSHLGENSAYKPREIISPTDAEKKFKAAKKDFAQMAQFITQSEGAISLEREDTAKPEIKTGLEFPIQEIV